ncbi:hypothetical protein R83H12_00387 [Fibrobacteria bacterium R8-3-H12]
MPNKTLSARASTRASAGGSRFGKMPFARACVRGSILAFGAKRSKTYPHSGFSPSTGIYTALEGILNMQFKTPPPTPSTPPRTTPTHRI